VLPGLANPDGLFAELLEALELHFLGACWHLTDPETGLFTWTGFSGELPGDFVSALENEFLEDDLGKYAEIAASRSPVWGLVNETGGEPERSARYRQQLAPDGFADELRFAFVDGFGRWGSMGLFSDRHYSAADQAAGARVVPDVARRLREAAAVARRPADDGPGVLVLDAADRVLTRDVRAGDLLDCCARTGALPGAVHVLAGRARASGQPAAGRTLTDEGAWLAVDANPVPEDGGAVTIVLRPVPPPSVLEVRLRAAGLTEREREIALALVRGDDTAAIAAALHLSPWTVQDHLKAIFDKTGVRSRRAFVARWAFDMVGLG
jgi:DNA-binding CsgD family transcriptional regulator